jgi:hypothetical protein
VNWNELPSLDENLLMSFTKQFVFVLMPFDAAFDDVYQLGIRAACSDAGAYCERVDEQIFHESILERVYNQIGKADLLIADMTGRNPNVFYEVGYAHALGKRVFLLTRNADDIPFDLKHYPHIVYGGSISKLKDELEKRVRWAGENPEVPLTESEPQVVLFVGETAVADGATLVVQRGGQYFYLSVQITNTGSRVVPGTDLRLALITPYGVSAGPTSHQIIPLPDGKRLHHFPKVGEIFPGGWDSTAVELVVKEALRKNVEEGLPVTVRLVTRLGVRDFPVMLRPE